MSKTFVMNTRFHQLFFFMFICGWAKPDITTGGYICVILKVTDDISGLTNNRQPQIHEQGHFSRFTGADLRAYGLK